MIFLMEKPDPRDPCDESLFDADSEADFHERTQGGLTDGGNAELELEWRLHAATVPRVEPPAALKDKLLPNQEKGADRGPLVTRADDREWIDFPVRQGSVRIKVLAEESTHNVHTFLIHCAPDSFFPEHKHLEFEHLYVLEGDFQSCGMTLRQGDFLRFGEGQHHDESYTESGCKVLLVSPTSAAYSKRGYQGIAKLLAWKQKAQAMFGQRG